MKLKARSDRFDNACHAARCQKDDDLVAYAPGVAFPKEEGQVTLCPEHVKRRDKEKEADEGPQALSAKDTEKALQTALAAEATEAGEVLGMVKSFRVECQSDVDFANDALGEVKAKLKDLKAKKERATQPLNAALKAIRGWFKPAEEFYAECEELWKLKIRDGMKALEAAQLRALAAASAAHESNDLDLMAESMAQASFATAELPANVSIVERWTWKVLDESLVPREYLMLDEAKIGAVVRAMKGAARIPGIETVPDDIVVRRAG
jgi:hypothetical protein